MDDREKVIKGFTICSKHGLFSGEDCHGHYEYTDNMAEIIKANDYSKQCPYNGCRTGCVKTLAKDALALLKEQEPVSVAGPDSYEEYWDREAICPDCGTHWMSYDKNGKRVTKYCPGCRRQVKWE